MKRGSVASSPAMTVLMAVHDAADHVDAAIDSVLMQDFTDFEFVIVDDGSKDATPDRLQRAARRDPRIRVLRSAANQGLTAALNVGLAQARGDCIVRIDADDRCFAGRLARQWAFLRTHQDHVAVACGHRLVDGRGRTLRTQDQGLDDWQTRWMIGFMPPAPHPTYCFRRRIGSDRTVRYDERFRTAQDFELWSRLADTGKTAVLPQVLVEYRRHPATITMRHRAEQAENCRRIGAVNLARRLPPALLQQLAPLLDLFGYREAAGAATIPAAVRAMDALVDHDLRAAPSRRHRAWLRRTAAALLADAVLARGGALRRPDHTLAFVREAKHHLPYLAAAVLRAPGTARKSLMALAARGRQPSTA